MPPAWRDQGTTAWQDPGDPEFSLMVPEKQKVIAAIKKLNFRATPPELAAASELSINQSAFWLNKIAGETRGKLEVAGDGTVYYSFSRNFTGAYLQRGLKKVALVVLSATCKVLYWVIRVSFGVALALSILVIVVIFVLLIAVAIAAMTGDSGDGGDGFDFGGDFFDLYFLADLFRWDYSPSHTYYPNSLPSDRRDKYSSFVEKNPKGNFFLDCFSFLFGDGAPNSNLQEIRWQQIVRVIKENGGVVSTEQLSPFLDGDRSDSGMILGALAQFNGRPEVTKSGYIVYVFPDYLDEPNARRQVSGEVVPYLEEQEWQFSGLSAGPLTMVIVLAGLNFAGSWWLFKHIATIHMLHELALLIDVLLTYAVVFFAIPAIRFVTITVLNYRIRKRNKRREDAYWLQRSSEPDIVEELQEARQVQQQERAELLHRDRRIVFSSDQDSLEQQFEPPSQIVVDPQLEDS